MAMLYNRKELLRLRAQAFPRVAYLEIRTRWRKITLLHTNIRLNRKVNNSNLRWCIFLLVVQFFLLKIFRI